MFAGYKLNQQEMEERNTKKRVEDKPKWEEEMDEVLEDTIIDGGFDYSKQDAWIDATEARKRIKAFLAKQKELSYKEGYEKGNNDGIENYNL